MVIIGVAQIGDTFEYLGPLPGIAGKKIRGSAPAVGTGFAGDDIELADFAPIFIGHRYIRLNEFDLDFECAAGVVFLQRCNHSCIEGLALFEVGVANAEGVFPIKIGGDVGIWFAGRAILDNGNDCRSIGGDCALAAVTGIAQASARVAEVRIRMGPRSLAGMPWLARSACSVYVGGGGVNGFPFRGVVHVRMYCVGLGYW